MDNYEVAISGTNLAAEILVIEAPEVQFFKIKIIRNEESIQSFSKKSISSLLTKNG